MRLAVFSRVRALIVRALFYSVPRARSVQEFGMAVFLAQGS